MTIITNLWKKIPAAIMIVPMFLSAIINSIFPGIVQIGGITTAIFSKSAAVPLTGAVLFFVGTQLKLKEAPKAVLRGGVLLVAKFIAGFIPCFIVIKMFGIAGIFGVSVLALFNCLLTSNGAIYLALTGENGDELDLGAYSVLCLKDSPLLTLLAIGASGAAVVSGKAVLATILPMLIGLLLGTLFEGVRKYFKPGMHVCIPLIAIAIGASLDLKKLFTAGIGGIVLGVFVVLVGGIILILADKFILKRPGYAGASLATVSGSAVAYPAIVATVVPSMQPYVASASVQTAAAVIVTAILGPILTSWAVKKWGDGKTEITNEQTV
ncbi:2-keto-3-deoxygluconate permease [Clostridium luticellarii]|jgi:2-keto-3-deoxygluconate permease|uniref:2-keto-3-deoxygluconate permease n=1 Tax=Clostridium luticellarii TaxID=1691940 RepID=UPI002357E202|nr:2-keto-3-deoxygluconate permease [Clostridium luticellarii]MCI1945500.1 2-keto-3-deoxygluconate permease [Clostridium luticellarii]